VFRHRCDLRYMAGGQIFVKMKEGLCGKSVFWLTPPYYCAFRQLDAWMCLQATHDRTAWVNECLIGELPSTWLRNWVSGKGCMREWTVDREGKWVAGEWNESVIQWLSVSKCFSQWREILLTYLMCRLPCTSFKMQTITKQIGPNFETRYRTLFCKCAGCTVKLEIFRSLLRVGITTRTFRISSPKWELGRYRFLFHIQKSLGG
jgi:hypothetical protein